MSFRNNLPEDREACGWSVPHDVLDRPGFPERLAEASSAPADALETVVGQWRHVVTLLADLGTYNGPEFHPDAYDFLRKHRDDIPRSILSEIGQTIPDTGLPPALAALLAPSERRSNLVARLEFDEARRRKAESRVTPLAPPVRLANNDDLARSRLVRLHRRDITVTTFDPALRDGAKAAFTLRRVPPEAMRTLIAGAVRPTSGDVVLARVDRIRHQTRIELPSGRKAGLDEGSLILVAYGDRYATDQFEAHVPLSLGPTNLIAVGGVAAQMLSRTSGMRSATEITPIGLVGNDRGEPLNLRDFALRPVVPRVERPRVIAVLGTSMNSGKTTTIRFMLNGLSKAGLKPGSTKVTGTGSGGDYWTMVDAGAHRVLDFTDAGFASTFRVPTAQLERAAFELVDHLVAADCGIVLVEVADGLFHDQNRELVTTDFFQNHVDGVMFAAGDALAASAGVAMLRELDIPVIGASGKMTASELMTREARKACPVPIYTRDDLRDPVKCAEICGLAPSGPFVAADARVLGA